jgi:hypothetical protein
MGVLGFYEVLRPTCYGILEHPVHRTYIGHLFLEERYCSTVYVDNIFDHGRTYYDDVGTQGIAKYIYIYMNIYVYKYMPVQKH